MTDEKKMVIKNKISNYHYFSANGVPYPLDESLKLRGEPTTDDMAEYCCKFNKFGCQNDR